TLLPLSSARAVIIGVETFEYDNGSVVGQNGGTHWQYDNEPPDTGFSGTPSNWDSSAFSTPQVSDQRLSLSNQQAEREFNGLNEGEGAINDVNNFSQVYFRVTVHIGNSIPSEFGMISEDFGAERIAFGKTISSNNFMVSELGVATSFSSTTIQANTTYTLVAKLDFPGNTIALWVDPDLNAPEGTPTVSRTYNGTNWSTSIRLYAFGSVDAADFDNVVVTTSWEELGNVVTTTVDEDDGSADISGNGVSLREAVTYAEVGELITFDSSLSGETFPLELGEISSFRPLTLDGSDLDTFVTIDGCHQSRLFNRSGAAQFILFRANSINFVNGDASKSSTNFSVGGAFYLDDTDLSLTRCTIARSTAADAGAIWVQGIDSDVTLDRCTIADNYVSTGFLTGGIVIVEGTLSIESCTISGNQGGSGGGGIYLESPAVVSLNRTIVAGNTVTSNAADISKTSGTISGVNNFIGSNESVETEFPSTAFTIGTSSFPKDPLLAPLANYGGGALTMHPQRPIDSAIMGGAGTPGTASTDQRGFPRLVEAFSGQTPFQEIGAVEAGSSYFVNTSVDEDDGDANSSNGTGTSLREAINYSSSGDVITFTSSMANSTITLGASPLPINKDLFIDASNLTDPLIISGNNQTEIFNVQGGTAVIDGLNLTDGFNSDGGAVFQDGGSFTIIRSSLYNNSTAASFGDGGAIISRSGYLELIRSTLTGNFASSEGGAIETREDLVIRESTIYGNTCSDFGGGIFNRQGNSILIVDSIIAGNTSGANTGTTDIVLAQADDVIAKGNNILSDLTSSSLSLSTPGLIVDEDLILTPLADNGGGTLTMVPTPGSQAIDGAASILQSGTDARGSARFAGSAPDLGAYELQSTSDFPSILLTVWEVDPDRNRVGWGEEWATGALTSIGREFSFLFDETGNIFTFGINPDAYPYVIWSLTRSTTDLQPGSFINIFNFDGPASTISTGVGVFHEITENSETDPLAFISDTPPTSNKVFYKFEVILD
ncbi:MAG: CSLREA domain-containing protein, partial [Verrucomicrobiota bacterium]